MGAFVDRSLADSEEPDGLCWPEVEEAELVRAAVEVMGWGADVGRRVEESAPEVEVHGRPVEAAARVKAGVRGASGTVGDVGGGGPAGEVSGGSGGLEVSLEEYVELRRGAVGRAELSSKSTRREE